MTTEELEKHEAGVKRVIDDIIKDKFIGKAERILKFIKDSGYKLPSEAEEEDTND